jgi:hypothetical protein
VLSQYEIGLGWFRCLAEYMKVARLLRFVHGGLPVYCYFAYISYLGVSD